MEGGALIRLIQFKITYYVTNEQPETERLIQRTTRQEQPLQTNDRGYNAIAILMSYFIGIGSIVIGSIHLNDCPAEKMIPICLVSFGGILIVTRLVNCVYDFRVTCKEESSPDVSSCFIFLNVILWLAGNGMFIALCYYALSTNPKRKPEDRALPNYCENTLYQTSVLGCVAIILLTIIGWCCC